MELRKSRLQYSVLLLLLVWSGIAQSIISGYHFYISSLGPEVGRLPFFFSGDSLEVRGSPSELASMNLKPGDELVALDGEPIMGLRQMERKRLSFKPGQKVEVTVRREQPPEPAKTIRTMVPIHARGNATLHWIFTIVMYTFVPAFSLLLGFWVAFSRPHDRLAWLTMAMLASFSQLAPGTFFGLESPWLQIVVGYKSLMSNTWPLWVMLFGLYFPRPFPFLRRYRWIPYFLALPFAALLLVDFYTDIYDVNRIAAIRTLAQHERRLESPLLVFFLLCIASFFVSLGLKLRRSKDPDARRRLQWLLGGSGVALAPALLFEFLMNIIQIDVPAWYATTSIVFIALFPLTLAYVIVVQRAMELRVAVRIGVQYAFARGGLTVLRIVLSACVIGLAITLAFEATGPVTAGVLIGAALALLSMLGRFGKRVTEWTDRKFFREAYDTEVILTQLSQNVAEIRDTKALLETVTRQISDSLHVLRVAVLLNSSEGFRPAYALGYENVPAVDLKDDAATIRQLKELKQPSKVYFDDEASWVQRTPDNERETLRMLDAQVLLPVTLKERLLGIISLGPKRSEEPYSNTDLRLLHAVASQTGLALENARLTESIRREVAQRERMNRELEIAREVQQRLFPQNLPAVEGFDYAGYCRPQQDVGGDYYDFVYVKETGLCVAVGDVSGKGIASALMMAALHASLRSQIMSPSGSPAEMLQLINRLVYDSSASNRYATFFYAQYDPRTRSLIYVNAGHNAPIVCRANRSGYDILRLEEGGTVLGLFPEVEYKQGCIQLQPCDLLVAFTDGISEAMNSADEEWDEQRLIQSICEAYGQQASEVLWHIQDSVDRFTAGAKQHDDMTLVVGRVK
jgi:sigma-B regulation protein RsbU (phosphoserine phosphatase)